MAVLVAAPRRNAGSGFDPWGIGHRYRTFQTAQHYVLRDALPRNTMDKVQKAQLRQELEAVFAT